MEEKDFVYWENKLLEGIQELVRENIGICMETDWEFDGEDEIQVNVPTIEFNDFDTLLDSFINDFMCDYTAKLEEIMKEREKKILDFLSKQYNETYKFFDEVIEWGYI
jgi:hypothetical protein